MTTTKTKPTAMMIPSTKDLFRIHHQRWHHTAHTLGQELNNQGLTLIEDGRYTEGIQLLSRALKFAHHDLKGDDDDDYATGYDEDDEWKGEERRQKRCHCQRCSLDSCLSASFGTCSRDEEESSNEPRRKKLKKITTRPTTAGKKRYSNGTIVTTSATSGTGNDDDDKRYTQECTANADGSVHQDQELKEEEEESKSGGYVYQQFVYANRPSIKEKHDQGMNLPLNIMLNLALAYHSQAIALNSEHERKVDDDTNTSSVNKILEKAMKLYELAYQFHSDIFLHQKQMQEEQNEEDRQLQAFESLRLTLIISNNLGAIHRLAGNHEKYQLCTDHLLSVVMYTIHSHIVDEVFRSISSDDDNADAFEGILRNACSFILQDDCASAA